MMRWDRLQFWRWLQSDRDRRRAEEPSDWKLPSARVVALAVSILLFGGLAVWIVVAVVRFFGRFWSLGDSLPQ